MGRGSGGGRTNSSRDPEKTRREAGSTAIAKMRSLWAPTQLLTAVMVFGAPCRAREPLTTRHGSRTAARHLLRL